MISQARASLGEWLNGKYNGVLARAGFQRWAARFPLTRPIAAGRAKALFDLSAGFVYSQTLFACTQLRVFHLLRDKPRSIDWLARETAVEVRRLDALLTAAVALKLLKKTRSGTYGLGRHGAAFLGNPALEIMIAHHALLYRDLADPAALLRNAGQQTELAAFWPYDHAGRGSEAAVAPYSAIMSETQALIAADVLDAYPFHRHRKMVDIGGGQGTFLQAVHRRCPDLRLVLFDLPAVAELAAPLLRGADGSSFAEVVGGSFQTDPLPTGADLMTLVRIAHDHDDDVIEPLFAKIAAALEPGGTLVIAEPMNGIGGVESVGAYFALYLLAMGRGRPRRRDELEAMLKKAGFAEVKHLKMPRPIFCCLIVAVKSQ